MPARSRASHGSRRRRRPVERRISVRKTYKLYIGGQFPRSESGRSYVVAKPDGTPIANACAGRARTFVTRFGRHAAPFPGWADRTAMNRGQILYRVAELMEGRREQFEQEVADAEGVSAARARGRWSIGRSIAGSGTPAGPTRSRRSSAP